MLETLTKGFRSARLKLQGRAELSEENIADALREVRVSLLEADVELDVVKAFLARVQERAVGEVVTLTSKSKRDVQLSPGDHFVKICHEELEALMGGEDEEGLNLDGKPALIMMVGLQGSGKTTTAGKLARKLMKEGRKPMLVAADIYRPAAIDQLMTLGRKLGVPVFSIKGMKPVQLCELAVTQARNVGRDVVIFDTAGRLAIDNELMQELVEIKARTQPANILFVCDAMIGQDAVRTAAEFDRLLDFTGFVLTKMDGDARGGAALSIKQVTGKPIKFLGMGEGLDKLEDFRAEGLASRILGFGDIVGLVKDFEEHVDEESAERDAQKMLRGDFTFDDFLKQLETIQKMGSLKDLFERLPFFSDLKDAIPAGALDDKELVRIKAMIQSMTMQERNQPDVMNDSRLRRIARGSGHSFKEVEEVFQRFLAAREMMKNIGASGMFGNLRQAAAMRNQMSGGFPGMMPGMGMGMGMSPDGGPARPQMSADEKKARRSKARAARKARKQGRKKR
ncbi:MAG: signal recognition particle protein [Alphaproteobacteria bacterium]|nr:signal recognition particle protein [Alphaproteobacteria bacterium]